MDKATNFKFCTHILSIDQNNSPLKIYGAVAGCVVRTLKTFKCTHISGASRGLLCDSYAVLFLLQAYSHSRPTLMHGRPVVQYFYFLGIKFEGLKSAPHFVRQSVTTLIRLNATADHPRSHAADRLALSMWNTRRVHWRRLRCRDPIS